MCACQPGTGRGSRPRDLLRESALRRLAYTGALLAQRLQLLFQTERLRHAGGTVVENPACKPSRGRRHGKEYRGGGVGIEPEEVAVEEEPLAATPGVEELQHACQRQVVALQAGHDKEHLERLLVGRHRHREVLGQVPVVQGTTAPR